MENEKINHWDIMDAYNHELSEKVTAWRKEISKNDVIPPKYQELMKMAMACTIRFPAAINAHAQGAIKNGASKEEIFETLVLAMMIGGIPAYREGATLLKDLLMKDR